MQTTMYLNAQEVADAAKACVWSTMMLAVHAQRHVLLSEGIWLRSGVLINSKTLY